MHQSPLRAVNAPPPFPGAKAKGFAGLSFTPRVQKLLAARDKTRVSRNATPSEIAAFSDQVRTELGAIAAPEMIMAMQRHNPAIFQILVDPDAPTIPLAFNAALPLTEAGAAALVEGAFDPLAPQLHHVAREGEPAAAIYVWLTWTPGSFIASLKGLSAYVERLAPDGCPLFCRGATAKSDAFLRSIGYEEAALSYAKAPAGLLVVHPIAAPQPPAPQPPASPRLTIDLARSMDDVLKVFAIRAATYMADQHCPYAEEFDGNDFCAAHFIGYSDGEPAGCLRVRFFAGFVKFERLAVRREYRQSKLAFRLVREAMRYAAAKGYAQVYGHARHDLVRFWQSFGFRPLQTGQALSFSDVDYVEMAGPIKADPNAVKIGDSPYRIIRPEHRWDVPGPLERAIDPVRAAALASQWRGARSAGNLDKEEKVAETEGFEPSVAP